MGILFFSMFFPAVAKADVPPELNQICWRKLDCDATRALYGGTPGDGGWFQEDPCVGEWGKCLPTRKTRTQISFGGKQEFNNIGEFLKTNYNLALTIAGILAVIMIVVAGVQWVTSGGNSEMITSAKKRIGGALTGLLIAYLSYTILNTVNPAMVNLRLPENFLIRPAVFVTNNLCVDLEKTMKVAPIKEKTDSPTEDTYIDSFKDFATADDFWEKASDYELLNPLRETETKCGQLYLVKDGGGATCNGSSCDKGEVCVGDKTKSCQKFSTSGEVNGIKGSITFTDEKYIDDLWLYALCSDNTSQLVGSKDVGKDSKNYNFTNIEMASYCGGYDKIQGFYFKMELNDSDTMSSDDQWIGGTSFCKNITNAPSCGVMGTSDFGGTVFQAVAAWWSSDSIFSSDKTSAESLSQLGPTLMGLNNQLIKRSYVNNGFLCDLDLKKDSLPNIGNGVAVSAALGLGGEFAKDVLSKLSAAKIDLKSDEMYLVGANYNCPYFTNESALFKAKLKKIKCKLHPEKAECNK
ncbi:MAG: hypothetical protein ACD_72C00421G0002 [uncultured bacterium]|nr:MAG: hypothetical protein ACD_72C00421G0002 [uncultured bacterium]